jgi:hypothetical protein
MSFLNQLKNQAKELQTQQDRQHHSLEENTVRTEAACRTVQHYLQELARQLNVIEPAAPKFTLDGKTPWPAMKLVDFRADARRKVVRGKEVCDYAAMGWRIVPQVGKPVGGMVRVNFPPDLQRVESRLGMGPIKHERKEIRHPEKNTLLAIQFDYLTEARGNVQVTADHDRGVLAFRLLNAIGFDIAKLEFPAVQVRTELLDELAKLIVSQPHRFV